MYNIIILLKKKNYKKYHKELDNVKVIMYNIIILLKKKTYRKYHKWS